MRLDYICNALQVRAQITHLLANEDVCFAREQHLQGMAQHGAAWHVATLTVEGPRKTTWQHCSESLLRSHRHHLPLCRRQPPVFLKEICSKVRKSYQIHPDTSTVQGGRGSFQNRKPIGGEGWLRWIAERSNEGTKGVCFFVCWCSCHDGFSAGVVLGKRDVFFPRPGVFVCQCFLPSTTWMEPLVQRLWMLKQNTGLKLNIVS